MAQPVTPKCLKGCCLSVIIVVLLIAALIGVSVAVVLNMTPDKLGIADMPLEFLNGKTLRDYGLADVKIKEAFKLLKGIMNPDEDAIVTNRYNESVDKPAAQENAANSNIVKENGGYDYSSIVSDKVVYDKEYLKTYNDTTIAYIFDSMIKDMETGIEAEGDPDSTGVKFLRDLQANVDEVTIAESGDGYSLRIVASISLASLQEELRTALSSAKIPQFLIKIPDRIYIVSYGTLTADGKGKPSVSPADIRINDMENAVADVIFSVLSEKAAESGGGDYEGQLDPNDKNSVNAELLDAFASAIGNLGKIGTATVKDGTDEIVKGSEIYGVSGISAHKLTVITYTSAE